MKNAIYVRVSSESQDYKRQIEDLQAVCHRNGWANTVLIKDKMSVFSESINDRDGFSRLKKMVDNAEVENIIVWEISTLCQLRVNTTQPGDTTGLFASDIPGAIFPVNTGNQFARLLHRRFRTRPITSHMPYKKRLTNHLLCLQ